MVRLRLCEANCPRSGNLVWNAAGWELRGKREAAEVNSGFPFTGGRTSGTTCGLLNCPRYAPAAILFGQDAEHSVDEDRARRWLSHQWRRGRSALVMLTGAAHPGATRGPADDR